MKRFHVERIEPVLRVENMETALRFYVDVLGFQNAAWGNDDFTSVSRDGGSLYLCRGDQGRGGAWVWIGVDDVRPLYEDLMTRGVPILLPPTIFPWALEMRIADPDGNVLRFGSESE